MITIFQRKKEREREKGRKKERERGREGEREEGKKEGGREGRKNHSASAICFPMETNLQYTVVNDSNFRTLVYIRIPGVLVKTPITRSHPEFCI